MKPDRAQYLIHVHDALEITGLKAPEYLDALETIAGMRPEYAVQGKVPNSDEWLTLSQWSEALPSSELELGITLTYEDTGETYQVDTRIVKRYVTAPQPLGEDQ